MHTCGVKVEAGGLPLNLLNCRVASASTAAGAFIKPSSYNRLVLEAPRVLQGELTGKLKGRTIPSAAIQ